MALAARDVVQPARKKTSRWIDISVPLYGKMVHWPGDPPVQIEKVTDIRKGDTHTLSRLVMGSHTGTHIDAPLHFLSKGASIDEMPLDVAIGRARVIEIRDTGCVSPEELALHRIRPGERLLFKTRNSGQIWRTDGFSEDFVFLSHEAALLLARRRVRLVGIDYLSVGGYMRDGAKTHHVLLEAGVWVLEGLDLSSVSAGRYDLVCLPLRIREGDGAPARAAVRPLGGMK